MVYGVSMCPRLTRDEGLGCTVEHWGMGTGARVAAWAEVIFSASSSSSLQMSGLHKINSAGS